MRNKKMSVPCCDNDQLNKKCLHSILQPIFFYPLIFTTATGQSIIDPCAHCCPKRKWEYSNNHYKNEQIKLVRIVLIYAPRMF